MYNNKRQIKYQTIRRFMKSYKSFQIKWCKKQYENVSHLSWRKASVRFLLFLRSNLNEEF